MTLQVKERVFMNQVKCIKSFAEDGIQYWIEGKCYEVVAAELDGIEIVNEFGGVGFVYNEELNEYFER